MQATRAFLALLGALMLVSPLALAGHGGGPVSQRRTYELAAHNNGAGFVLDCPLGTGGVLGCDPTGQAQDGSVDLGGAVFVPPDDHAVSSVSIQVFDDRSRTVFGQVCQDVNADGVCGDQHDLFYPFCDTTGVLPVRGPVVVFVYGVVDTTLNCAPSLGATTGGVLDPSAGIFATFSVS